MRLFYLESEQPHFLLTRYQPELYKGIFKKLNNTKNFQILSMKIYEKLIFLRARNSAPLQHFKW